MNEQKAITLSKKIMDNLSVNDIIYAEVAEGGAMGNAGGISVYILEDKQLIRYETDLLDDENSYLRAIKLLFQHQNKCKYENLEVNEILFDYYYGGMGNHVFVNQQITLKKDDDFFIFQQEGDNYKIYCSVQGVFNCVAYSIEN